MASDGKNPGLLLVRAKAKNPDLTDEALNKWYSTVHIQDVVNSGAADLAIRYKNLDPKAEYPYLCLYRVPDLGFVQDAEKMAKIPKTSDLLPGSHDYREELTLERRVYGLLQKFEGQDEQKDRAKCVVMVGMEPAAGTDDEFDEWYRKQHLDMISMVDNYHRSTRYKLTPGSDSKLPSYLALHEHGVLEQNPSQMKKVVGSVWSKKIIGEAKMFDRSKWEYITEYAKEGVSGAKL